MVVAMVMAFAAAGVTAYAAGSAWSEDDERKRVVREIVSSSLAHAGYNQYSAAYEMWGDTKHEAELSHQLAGRRPLNLFLLFKLNARFQLHFVKLWAKQLGSDVIEPGVMADLVTQVNALVERMKGQAA